MNPHSVVRIVRTVRIVRIVRVVRDVRVVLGAVALRGVAFGFGRAQIPLELRDGLKAAVGELSSRSEVIRVEVADEQPLLEERLRFVGGRPRREGKLANCGGPYRPNPSATFRSAESAASRISFLKSKSRATGPCSVIFPPRCSVHASAARTLDPRIASHLPCPRGARKVQRKTWGIATADTPKRQKLPRATVANVRTIRTPNAERSNDPNDPDERFRTKKGGVPGAAPRQMEDRLRRCVAAADVAVDYFFATFAAVFGAAAAVFAAAAKVTLWAIFCPLFSM